METINGVWYMKGCRRSDRGCLHSPDDLLELVREVGFLPLFSNDIPGFSVEEHTPPADWWTGSSLDPWDWRQLLAPHPDIAYGKFFDRKAGFVSREWFPDFANYRRDGYDFDARYDDGLAPRGDLELYNLIDQNAPILSKPLKQLGDYRKGGKKGFDGAITRLQKQCYVLISDFGYATDKEGNQYGWGIAEYSTPEKFLGRRFTDKVYQRSPEESCHRVVKQFRKILPGVAEDEIRRLLGK